MDIFLLSWQVSPAYFWCCQSISPMFTCEKPILFGAGKETRTVYTMIIFVSSQVISSVRSLWPLYLKLLPIDTPCPLLLLHFSLCTYHCLKKYIVCLSNSLPPSVSSIRADIPVCLIDSFISKCLEQYRHMVDTHLVFLKE